MAKVFNKTMIPIQESKTILPACHYVSCFFLVLECCQLSPRLQPEYYYKLHSLLLHLDLFHAKQKIHPLQYPFVSAKYSL